MEDALASGELDNVRNLDARFHQFFLDYSDNSRLNKTFKVLVPTSRRIRNICFSQENNIDFLTSAVKRHREYAEAIKNKDIVEIQRILMLMNAEMRDAVKAYIQDDLISPKY